MKQEMALTYQLEKISKDCLKVGEYAQEMHMLNQSYIQGFLQAVYREEQEELEEMLKNYRKLRRVIASLDRSERGNFDFECGIFMGTYKILTEIEGQYDKRKSCQLSGSLLEKKHVTNIIDYLYENPDARHKDIADYAGVSPNYLSEILNQLMDADYVSRYGKNKSTRYRLTRMGREIYRMLNRVKKQNEICIDVSYREILDKERFLKERETENERSNINKENKYATWKKNLRYYSEFAGIG